MKFGYIVSSIGIVLVVLGAVTLKRNLHAEAHRSTGEKFARAGAVRTPVLVELFTSEGCSSCPSADRLLADLTATQAIVGAEIIALEEHVDYWDRIGWKDPFSNAAFTKRQYDYGHLFHLDSVYTPQAVVDGQKEFVGSDRGAALSAVTAAAREPKAEVKVEITGADTAKVRLNVSVARLSSGNDAAQVVLAVAEDGLKAHVEHGENSGRDLVHHGVVRQLVTLGKIQRQNAFTTQTTVPLNSQWRRENLRAVAFVQSEQSHRILGVGAVTVKPPR